MSLALGRRVTNYRPDAAYVNRWVGVEDKDWDKRLEKAMLLLNSVVVQADLIEDRRLFPDPEHHATKEELDDLLAIAYAAMLLPRYVDGTGFFRGTLRNDVLYKENVSQDLVVFETGKMGKGVKTTKAYAKDDCIMPVPHTHRHTPHTHRHTHTHTHTHTHVMCRMTQRRRLPTSRSRPAAIVSFEACRQSEPQERVARASTCPYVTASTKRWCVISKNSNGFSPFQA